MNVWAYGSPRVAALADADSLGPHAYEQGH